MVEGSTGGGAPPVIRIVRRKGHAAHHGGAWKVAYADFVTAMMAFFLVMWIVGLSEPVREAIQAYFRDPVGFSEAVRAGQSPLGQGETVIATFARPNAGEAEPPDARRLEAARRAIVTQLEQTPELRTLRDSVRVRLDNEGLRIELIERSSDLFFDSGSAALKPRTYALLKVIATELRALGRPLVLEGHTDSRPLRRDDNYTNWELSTDRANAARRALIAFGLPPTQVVEVRGYADRRPLRPKEPAHFSNRRVSILVRNRRT